MMFAFGFLVLVLSSGYCLMFLQLVCHHQWKGVVSSKSPVQSEQVQHVFREFWGFPTWGFATTGVVVLGRWCYSLLLDIMRICQPKAGTNISIVGSGRRPEGPHTQFLYPIYLPSVCLLPSLLKVCMVEKNHFTYPMWLLPQFYSPYSCYWQKGTKIIVTSNL